MKACWHHPFMDGNERTGFMVAVTFLELNGMVFMATEESVVEQTLGLASGGIKEPKYGAWLKAHSKRH